MNNTNKESLATVIEAPSRLYTPKRHNLFLVGGISNCPDWQSTMIDDLSDVPDLNIFNPRRANFSVEDQSMSDEQIEWEFEMLDSATEVSVWFSNGSINPIVLYELGLWVNGRPQIPAAIGIDPGYERTYDVIKQTELARPELEIVFSLEALTNQVRAIVGG